jgi:hypothetical protein
MLDMEDRNTRKTPAPLPLSPPQNPYGLTRARTLAAAVESRRLAVRAMGTAISPLVTESLIGPVFPRSTEGHRVCGS